MFLIERTVTVNNRTTHQAMLYVTSLAAEQADPADLLAYVRRHWSIEVLPWVGDVYPRRGRFPGPDRKRTPRHGEAVQTTRTAS
ncbi:MAG: hypothetical protein SYR96_33020 [Actinomycetota bacterium]|nr:hypothetical protein [Actinomycetota bacterium]